ncbi:MAG: acyl-CoA desaturase [Gemmatimonadetes bacterium]|nr:acyl-CoA desaturase [Gemmatimonadota bacterium]
MSSETPTLARSGQAPGGHADAGEPHSDIVYPDAIPFAIIHLAALGVLWSGFTVTSVVMCVTLYLVRMWAVTAGFHRYFAHRSYKTSRGFQFFLAFLGQTSAQRGVLWWSAIHRHHHRHSDTPQDVHSPRHEGFFFSHVGWIFSKRKSRADYSTVQDLAQYPELRWLDEHPYLPAAALGVGCYLFAGWPGLFVGFILSTVILYHCVFSINSLAHVVGNQRYVTADDSRNNWWLAIITLGEGWHNNHHRYQSSTRQGFFWWEVDISYYVLKVLFWAGLVRDLRAPPKALLAGEIRLGRKVVEQVAREVAESFPVEHIARELKAASDRRPGLAELKVRLAHTRLEAAASLQRAREEAVAYLREVHLPEIPSLSEIRGRIAEQYHDSPSMDDIALRAREILLERLCYLLGPELLPSPS